MTTDDIKPVLWGMPASLYTAKVRSYLRHQGVDFEERMPGDPRFMTEVVPHIGRWIIPVLQMPDGELIQDGSVIVDELQARAGHRSVRAADDVLEVLALLFEYFGGEGLLRAAMHYRWNFNEHNEAFLRADFKLALAPGKPDDEAEMVYGFASARMRKAMAAFGVSPETQATIEASTMELLGLLDAHFKRHPFLLGERPTRADYGLVGALHAHLGRDPHPASLMKRTAIHLWRWTERMNASEQDMGEFLVKPPLPLRADDLPDTLLALLRFMATEFLSEVRGHVSHANAWLAERPDLPEGSSGLARSSERHIGHTEIDWRGHRIRIWVMPYRLYLLQRFQDAFDALPEAARQGLQDTLQAVGLGELPSLRTTRRVERAHHLEVWGARRT